MGRLVGLLAAMVLVLSLAGVSAAQITPGSGVIIQQNGVTLNRAPILNCIGSVLCTVLNGVADINVAGVPAGTVTGTGTNSVFTIWTNGPGSVIGDSVFQQNTSAIVKKGSTASVGGIGFNNAGNVEVVADGSTVVNAGLFAGIKSDFTIHDSVNENNWQFLMYNDSEGLASGVVTSIYGTAPNNTWQLTFGDGAGGVVAGFGASGVSSSVVLGPSTASFAATNFQFGAAGSALISSPSGSYVSFDLTGSPSAPNGNSHTFQISDGTSVVAFIVQHDGTSSISQANATNNAGTATAGFKSEILGNAGSSTKSVATMEVLDPQGDVSLNLFSPTNSPLTSPTNVSALSLNSTQVGAGTGPYMFWPKPGGGAGIGWHAPDSIASNVLLTWPNAFPASSGLALNCDTAVSGVSACHFSTLANSALANSSVTINGTANQINTTGASVSLGGSATLSLSSTLVAPGSLTVTTRTGTPATMAVFTSGGVLAETTLPSSGTVTSIATTSPITGGTITTTGTIACATCVTAASALTSGHLVGGAGGQATAITDLTGDTTTSGGVATTTGKVNGVTYPSGPSVNTVPVVTNAAGGGTVTYEAVPNAALANSSVTVNGTTCTLGSSCLPSASTSVLSWSNAPVPADWGINTLTMSSTLTVRYAQFVNIPFAITVNQISVAFAGVTTPGTFKVCTYSADGSTKTIDITITPAAATLVSGAVSGVTIGPGSFWFVIGGATSNSGVNIRTMSTESGISVFTASRPSGKTIWHGTVSHTSGTCNSSLGTVTYTSDAIPNFVLDN